MSAKVTKKLLVTGATGLVGARFLDLFKSKFSIVTLGRKNVDIRIHLLSQQDVLKVVFSQEAKAVINFAAYTNVDRAESEKGQKQGEVYIINALLPFWLSKACKASGKKLYHISTDYVFGGKQESRPYTEEDLPKPPDSWYSITKFQGELNVRKGFGNNNSFAIIRISFPYSGVYQRKLDFARTITDKLIRKEPYFGITDQKIKPASVDDIASALNFLLAKEGMGIYHLAGNYPKGYITPYEFAQKLAQIMNLDSSLIKPVSFLELSKKRLAPRPKNTWLDTSKIESLGFSITNLDDALKRFKQQLLNS